MTYDQSTTEYLIAEAQRDVTRYMGGRVWELYSEPGAIIAEIESRPTVISSLALTAVPNKSGRPHKRSRRNWWGHNKYEGQRWNLLLTAGLISIQANKTWVYITVTPEGHEFLLGYEFPAGTFGPDEPGTEALYRGILRDAQTYIRSVRTSEQTGA